MVIMQISALHKIALYYINDHQLLLTDVTRDISQEMIIRQVPVSLLRLTFAYFLTIHSSFCYAVNDPEKYLLLCDEVELTVKKYGCSVERAMRRHINKDRRVLNRFVGIYHLQRTDLNMYMQVGITIFYNVFLKFLLDHFVGDILSRPDSGARKKLKQCKETLSILLRCLSHQKHSGIIFKKP